MSGLDAASVGVGAAELLALAARCETASGPDRVLDVMITLTLTPGLDGTPEEVDELLRVRDEPTGYGRYRRADELPYPPLTASLDAALALVAEKLPNSWWCSRSDEAQGAYGAVGQGTTTQVEMKWCAYAATPALALCAALLRALAHQERPDVQD